MSLKVRHFGLCGYLDTYREMVDYTSARQPDTADEIWFLQHAPVYTLGMAGKTEHLLDPGRIPVVRSDRGGQVTYHGPGQLLAYLLLDIQRRHLGIREFVDRIEQAIIDTLGELGLHGERKTRAPGVYIEGRKIAALGIRIRNGCSYHGLALNVDLDLEPYQGINPCGYPGLEVTRLTDYGISLGVADVTQVLQTNLLSNLGYSLDDVQGIFAGHPSIPLQAIA